jgi:hypothetical protein
VKGKRRKVRGTYKQGTLQENLTCQNLSKPDKLHICAGYA